jgi:hypothetical protein
MNPRLLALLVGVGAATVGIAVFTLKPGVTKSDLIDAGILDSCAPVRVSCPARLTEAALQELEGNNRTANHRYRMLGTRAMFCGTVQNGQLILPVKTDVEWFAVHRCKRQPAQPVPPEDGPAVIDPDDCFCRRATGTCNVRTRPAQGRTQVTRAAPFGVTLSTDGPFDQVTGAGCHPKACEEIAGESSWPAECPPG